jgi:hypothetical protein
MHWPPAWWAARLLPGVALGSLSVNLSIRR